MLFDLLHLVQKGREAEGPQVPAQLPHQVHLGMAQDQQSLSAMQDRSLGQCARHPEGGEKREEKCEWEWEWDWQSQRGELCGFDELLLEDS